MAANRILKESGSFFNFASEGFKYNLQVLPDVITSSAILFAILFQSPPMAVFAAAILSLGFFHSYFAQFLASVFPDMVTATNNTDQCSGRFPGVSYEKLLGLSRSSGFGGLSTDSWPSYYITFIGFLTGWIGALPSIYAPEIAASPRRAASVSGGLITLAILCVIVAVYRIMSGCEGMMSTSIGLLFGFLIGLGFVIVIAWITERRGTNMLAFPLIRDKAADGKPIYVCERPAAKK